MKETRIMLGGMEIEKVRKFKYLGATLSQFVNMEAKRDIRRTLSFLI